MKINLSIRKKLILLSIVTIVFFGIQIFVGKLNFNKMEKLDHLILKATELNVQMLKLRKNEKDFLLRDIKNENFYKSNKSKYLDKFEKEIVKVHATLLDLKKSESLLGINLLNKLSEIDEYFNTYHDGFNLLVNSYANLGFKNYGTVGEMRMAVKTVEKTIINYPELTVNMLMLRRHEKDYFLRKDLQYATKFKLLINSFSKTIENYEYLSETDKYNIQTKLKEYESSFNKVLKANEIIGYNENEGVRGELRAEVHKVEPAIVQLIDEIENARVIIEKKFNTYSLLIIFTLLIILIAVTTIIVRSILNSLKITNNALKKLSIGNLSFNIEITTNDEVGEMLKNLRTTTTKLRSIIENIILGANNIANASEQLSSTSQQLSQSSTEQASSVEEVSATMEEMVTSIEQNSNNAQITEKTSIKALNSILEVSNQSSKSVDSSKVIAGKIQIITDIAFQTNILALNAAVEAARAGEQGKGFAVVAAEVRKLAERSKLAADEIVDLAQTSVQLAEVAGLKMTETQPEMEKTTSLIQEISSASLEQNNGVNQINNAIQQLNELTQQNAAGAEETASSAEELASQAEQLKEIVSFFKIREKSNILSAKMEVEP